MKETTDARNRKKKSTKVVVEAKRIDRRRERQGDIFRSEDNIHADRRCVTPQLRWQ